MIVPNPWHVDLVIKNMKMEWPDSLHILTDFDRTLTYGTVWWIKTPSLISLLRDGKHLSHDYPSRAIELFNEYHPIEIDPKLSLEEKKPIMRVWWQKHFSLMIECWLKKDDVFDVIKKSHLKLRNHVDSTLQLLRDYSIPCIIISAGAIGEAIPLFLSWNGLNFPNISYICNHFKWDESGRAIAIHEPIIHVFNKDETSVRELPQIFDVVQHRKNIILIWDSLWDIGMSHGFDYQNILKIWFMNPEDENLRADFIEQFDIIIEWDGDFSVVKDTLENILL